MLRKLRKLLRDESGPEIVEWALVTAVLLLATGVLLAQIYDEVLVVMRGILAQLLR